jgi:glycosyltransferase involved in cell wall biosynthesis
MEVRPVGLGKSRQIGQALSTASVLLVAPYVPPHVGGVEQYVDNLSNMLRDRHGVRVVIATAGAPGQRAHVLDQLDSPRIYHLGTSLRVSNTPVGFRWRSQIRKIVRRESIELINAHSPVPFLADCAGEAARAARRPFVLTYHTGSMRKGEVLSDFVTGVYERTLLRHTASLADWAIASSDYVIDSFPREFGAKATVVSPGVDLSRFKPSQTTYSTGVILFAGSLATAARYKGLHDLLRAMQVLVRRNPNTRLEIAGDGDGEAGFREETRRLGIDQSVTFHGRLGRADLADAYRAASLVCLPSHSDSFPTVLVEAMASGLPVVSTTVGGIPSLVQNDAHGLLVTPGDVPALIDALQQILNNPARAISMGARGREKVTRELSWENQSDRTMEVFNQVVAPRTGQSRPRTIAIVSPYYPPAVGGVERYAEALSRRLHSEPRYRPIVVTTRPGILTRYTTCGNVPVVQLGSWCKLSNTPFNPLWPLVLKRLFCKYDVSLVNAHSPVPYLADMAILAAGHRQTVLTYHAGSMIKGGDTAVDKVVLAYERIFLSRLFNRAHAVVAVSPTSLAHSVSGAHIISPGVDLNTFTPNEAALPPHAKSTILFVGRLDKASSWKGVDVLITALSIVTRRVPDAQLRIVGDGDGVDALARLADRLDLRQSVTFSGILRGPELVNAYRSARMLVLPSKTAAESFGMTLIEAMACGKPVIASNVGGIPYVVEHEHNGILVNPDDPQQLADACCRALLDEELCQRLGTNGRHTAEDKYGWNSITDRYIDLFDHLLGVRG